MRTCLNGGYDNETKHSSMRTYLLMLPKRRKAASFRNIVNLKEYEIKDNVRKKKAFLSSVKKKEREEKEVQVNFWISFVKRVLDTVPFSSHKSENVMLSPENSAHIAKSILKDYIQQKLQSSGYSNSKIQLRAGNCEYSDYFIKSGTVLERLYPKVYCDVSRKVCMTMSSVTVVKNALTSVLEIMFRDKITWGRVLSMFAISSCFAEECVQQGHAEFVDDVINCLGNFVTHRLADWIEEQGGWIKFKEVCSQNKNRFSTVVLVCILIALVAFLTTYLLKML